jgi:hypothetical protein
MNRAITALVLVMLLRASGAAAQVQSATLSPDLTLSQPRVSGLAEATLPGTRGTTVSDDSASARIVNFQLSGVDAEPRHKSPALAWFLSWLVPGGGQGYNGQWLKAAAFFVPAAVGFGLAADEGFSCSANCGSRDAGLVILAAASVGSQIEAPIAASRINREAKKGAPSSVTLSLLSLSF